jgi:hypothetical protein
MYIIDAWLQKEMAGVSVCVHSRGLRDQIATAKDDEEEDLRFQRDAAAAALGFHAVKHHNEAQQMQHVCRKPEDIHRRCSPVSRQVELKNDVESFFLFFSRRWTRG